MILITRLKEQSKDLNALLIKKGYKTFQESFYDIQYYKNKIFYDKNNYYIFPSIHSVRSLINSNQLYKFKDANIFTIGEKVKNYLLKSGCTNIIATSIDSESLLKILSKRKFLKINLIYLCSNIINKDFLIKARKYKINIKIKIIYKTIPTKSLSKQLIHNLRIKKITAILFYSKLSADNFLDLISKYKIFNDVKKIHLICISDRVAKSFNKNKFKNIHISRKPNQMSLIEIIKDN